MFFHNLLENRRIHNLVQKLFLVGRAKALRNTEQYLRSNCQGRVLDVGCGTKRYAHLFGDDYYGIDINIRYLTLKGCGACVCADAVKLPFRDASFDSVFSVAFFHHADSTTTEEVFKEMIRVSKPGSTMVIIDAFFPNNRFDLIGYLIMKIERGRHAMTKEQFSRELTKYFTITTVRPVERAYPYTLYTFVLKAL